MGLFTTPSKLVDKYSLGLLCHEWGDIHLYLSLFFLVLLFFHVWFNWAWIVNSTKRYFGENWRNVLWGFSVGWIVVLVVGWIAVQF